MSFILRFDAKATELGIFFNDTAALKSRYTLKKSKVKGIQLAIYKNKTVGMVFNARKTTDYKVLSNFFVNHLQIDEDATDDIMNQMIGFTCHHNQEISDTMH